MANVIIGCERSGVIREAFRKRGHNAYSCDLEPADDGSKYHFQADIFKVLNHYDDEFRHEWDLGIFHPPCTYLSNSGVWVLYRDPERWKLMEDAARFFYKLLISKIPKICIENPVIHGHAKKIISRKQSQTIQPWQFGEDASKRTCLWLSGLPPLMPTKVIKKERYANQTPSGQNKLGPSKDRAKKRSRTYQGIADAMADQWGGLLNG